MAWAYRDREVSILGDRDLDTSIAFLTAAKTLTEADNGKTFFLNAAGGFTVTLPANRLAGFRCKFIVKTAPTTAYVISAATADTIVGSVVTPATGAADTETTAGADEINFVASTAVIGDFIDIISDGTLIYAYGVCSAAGGITFTN